MPLEPVLDVPTACWASDLCQSTRYEYRDERIIAITGQSVPIFIQVVWIFLISARILMRRLESLRSRLRALLFESERRNISMTC